MLTEVNHTKGERRDNSWTWVRTVGGSGNLRFAPCARGRCSVSDADMKLHNLPSTSHSAAVAFLPALCATAFWRIPAIDVSPDSAVNFSPIGDTHSSSPPAAVIPFLPAAGLFVPCNCCLLQFWRLADWMNVLGHRVCLCVAQFLIYISNLNNMHNVQVKSFAFSHVKVKCCILFKE